MITALFLSYLFGSIPFGKIVTQILTGKDITKSGSGNIGATNVYRTVSKKIGLLVLLLDGLKPLLALVLIKFWQPEDFETFKYLYLLTSILGHMYPIWLRFKGGKGVACYFGGNLLIDPLLTISSMVIWIIVVKITKLSSLGALISIILLTTIQFIFMNGTLNKIYVIVILILIMFKHKENIARLMSGKENKINF